ncbi:DUF3102 domain-containing protein [Nostoc flagelliforme FACHB-838]|uniref:DUF3102 domain-containing protein n=1 Tax=Nostoc flagelliforme FACHB-838 TaxID=2692904 RepID=A0ABR8DZ61_9NOSO|nr:DUF3102 domain-containing protein [Nostoc flagelliforme]MBD2534574.1 DUF3102 domain-containing protein [Nostoc flagelliforme FACHB-838]
MKTQILEKLYCMEISNDRSTAFPMEASLIPTKSEEIVEQPLASICKPDFKTIEEKQQRLVILAEDTRRRLKRSAMDIYCIGLNLLEAQNIIEHGEFLSWLRQEFAMGKTSAYEFINVAKAFESKFPIIGNLINSITPTALCKLAAPSTPEAARDEAIYLVKTGEIVDPKVVKNLINKYKTSKAAGKKQQKASSTSQKSHINKVKALVAPIIETIQIGQTTDNSISLTSTPQQDELQQLELERDIYKVQLEELKITNQKLQLDNAKLRSELIVLQNSKNK